MRIRDVYRDGSVLVTGGTGFLGKVLVEKLLRTCTEVRWVIVMIRGKRGLSSEERLEKMKASSVFDRLRAGPNQKVLNKLVLVNGDISSEPNMGLNAVDEQRLLDEVTIVFHAAATIRFDSSFEVTSSLNILGTKRLYDLCLRMRRLKSVVYVSTAFSGAPRPLVVEQLHTAKHPIDMNGFLEILRTGTPEEKLAEAERYESNQPNAYTLSKFFAEHLTDHYQRHFNLPVCIVRPSIVCNAIQEPTPGWVDGFQGFSGVWCEVARGTLACLFLKDQVIDTVPVDYVTHLMLVAAWLTIHNPSPAMRIYNHTSGSLNPVKWSYALNLCIRYGRIYPTKYMQLYPRYSITQNSVVYRINEMFYHMIPAVLFDIVLRLRGANPQALGIARLVSKQLDMVRFFMIHEFQFRVDNVVSLCKAALEASDHADFLVDVRNVDVPKSFENSWLGIRKYLLHDDISTVEAARRKLKWLYVGKWFISVVQMAVSALIGWKVLAGLA